VQPVSGGAAIFPPRPLEAELNSFISRVISILLRNAAVTEQTVRAAPIASDTRCIVRCFPDEPPPPPPLPPPPPQSYRSLVFARGLRGVRAGLTLQSRLRCTPTGAPRVPSGIGLFRMVGSPPGSEISHFGDTPLGPGGRVAEEGRAKVKATVPKAYRRFFPRISSRNCAG
jgi:hypothetical protein